TSYLNSQFLMYYNLPPNLLCGHTSRFYGAFIVNHASRSLNLPELEKKESSSCDDSQSVSDPCDSDSDDRFPCTKNKRYAWYVGFRVGNVVVAGDWAFDVNYQVVQANAIPDNDVSGIARGNYFRDSYTRVGRGNTNYRGWHAEGLYAITDHFTVNVAYNHTREDCRKIGGTHSYNELKVEAIYAF
ncbi:MAG: hypothetical protein KDK65_06365, partial [Chlamydiia bacterium]|nr:hypothetical protein [Chlamydiia bacterium]